MLRRIGVLTSLAVTAAIFAGVTSAQADTAPVGTVVSCVFGGLSGQLNPAIPNTVSDALHGGVHDVERGSYNFSGDADCVFEISGVTHVTVTAATAVIASVGFYDNIACGTGFAHDLDSNGTFVDAVLDSGQQFSFGGLRDDPAGYEIAFLGGQGPLQIGPDGRAPSAAGTGTLPAAGAPHNGTHGVDGGPAGNTSPHGTVVSNWVGDGEVHITPGNAPSGSPPNENCFEPSPPDPDGDTDEFRVTGFLSGARYQIQANGVLP